jgi:hypothetical protein
MPDHWDAEEAERAGNGRTPGAQRAEVRRADSRDSAGDEAFGGRAADPPGAEGREAGE